MRLAPVTGKLSKIRGKRQLTFSGNGVTVKQEMPDILEPFILGVETLSKLGATLDTLARHLYDSTQASTVQEDNRGPSKGVNSSKMAEKSIQRNMVGSM